MKHSNISIFIPHLGCPHQCSFCNQKTITGQGKAPAPEEVRAVLQQAVRELHSDKSETEIAFFGGSFTAVDADYQEALLQVAQEFVKRYGFKGIRVSTRPDAVEEDALMRLKRYGVTAVELGAQSMDDRVLLLNERGHTAEDVRLASKRIQQFGFELGLQMMVGLYGDTPETVRQTARELISLHPDTVRIYPTVVLEQTRLAQLLQAGKYQPLSLEEAVDLCAELLEWFLNEHIRVIKLGLHASEEVEGHRLGGIYHPAFRELCESRIYYRKACEAIAKLETSTVKQVTLTVNNRAVSKMIGQKRQNLRMLEQQGLHVRVVGDEALPLYVVRAVV